MTYQEAERATGLEGTANDDYDNGGECLYFTLRGAPDGIEFMGANGSIVRIEVWNRTNRTPSGVGVGSTEEEVQRAYPGRIEVQPHEYGGPDDHYLIYRPQDPAFAEYLLLFETEDGIVETLRSGFAEYVRLIEGCA